MFRICPEENCTNEHHPHHHPTNRPRNCLHQRRHSLKPGLPPAVRIQQSQRRKESALIRRGWAFDMWSIPDQCGIHHNERNHATFADVKRTGKEEYSGRDSDNELSEFQWAKSTEKIEWVTESHFENVRCRSSKRRFPHQGIYFQERRDLPDYHRKFQYHKCSADLQPGMEYEDCVNGRRWDGTGNCTGIWFAVEFEIRTGFWHILWIISGKI